MSVVVCPLLDHPPLLPAVQGTPPPELYGHTAVIDDTGGGLVIVFGGNDDRGRFNDDTYMYNVELKTWTKLADKRGALRRASARSLDCSKPRARSPAVL